MTDDDLSGIPGGSAFWKHYAERVISDITDNHARLEQLKCIKAQYDSMVALQMYSDVVCPACNHFFISDTSPKRCHVCSEFFCERFVHCSLRACSHCKKMCCLADRTYEYGRLICIDCIGEGSSASEPLSDVHSDSEQLSPSESEEEDSFYSE